MIEERRVFAISDGWIYIPHPAAEPGWCPVKAITIDGIWATIDCGREAPYVVHKRTLLRWSQQKPAEANQRERS